MNTQKSDKALIYSGFFVSLLFLYCILTPYAHSSSLLAPRIQEYAALYPDIYFLHIQGDENNPDFSMLPKLIGKDAKNLDYEHDPIVRADLLQAQLMRIQYSLRSRIPSATLFQTGKFAAYTKPYVCVLTLDEEEFIKNPSTSSHLMLGENTQTQLPINNLGRLDYETFMFFTLDHEIYHCLDAYLNGPSLGMRADEKQTDYDHFLSEYRADLYASLTTRQSYPLADVFLHLLTYYREMGLIDLDTEHYTVNAIRQGARIPKTEIRSKRINEIAKSIQQIVHESKPGIDEYSQLKNTARGMALHLSINHEGLNDHSVGAARNTDKSALIELIIEEFENARSHIITSNIYLRNNSDYFQ